MRQTTLSDTDFDKYIKKTSKERFMDDMDKILTAVSAAGTSGSVPKRRTPVMPVR